MNRLSPSNPSAPAAKLKKATDALSKIMILLSQKPHRSVG